MQDLTNRITQREKEVLTLIAYEHSSKEIASKLYVSYETVHTHRKNLLRKMDVKNAAGLVRVAFERGYISTMQKAMFFLAFFLFSYGISAQVNNSSPKNYALFTSGYEWNPIGAAAVGLPPTGVPTIKIGDVCSFDGVAGPLGTYLPPITDPIPVTWTDSQGILYKGDDTNSSIEIPITQWLNDGVVNNSPCEYTVIPEVCIQTYFLAFPLPVVCTPAAAVDHLFFSGNLTASTIFGDPAVMNTTSDLNLSGSTKINLKGAWRYSNGDSFDSALDFGTIGATTKHHDNSNRTSPVNTITTLGYTNKVNLSGMSTSTDVVYKFKISGDVPKAVTLSTNHSKTNFDTEIFLIDSDKSTVIEKDDDISSNNHKSNIEWILNPGVYYVIVEGYTSGITGDFRISVKADDISVNAGTLAQPSQAGLCYGASIPMISSSTDGSVSSGDGANLTYKWFKSIDNGTFLVIPGATSANLSSANAGTMGEHEISYKRQTFVEGVSSGFTNTVSFDSQDNFGFVYIASTNSPICAGDVAEYYIESSNGSADAGATVSYTLNGTVGSSLLDANGKLTISNSNPIAPNALNLTSVSKNGCSAAIIENIVNIDILPNPTSITCGQTIMGNNTSGSNAIFTYSGSGYLDEDNLGMFSWVASEDIYEFTVESDNSPVEISLTGMNTTDDLDLWVINTCDPMNVIVGSYNYLADEHISSVISAGTYYIVIDGYEANAASDYTLTLQSCGVTPVKNAVVDVECFETIAGTSGDVLFFSGCDASYMSDVYKITPASGGSMTINLTGLSANHDLYIYTSIESCSAIQSSQNNGNSNESITFTAMANTTYFIEVYASVNVSSSYSLEMACPVSCPCTTSVDYVEAISQGNVCIGSQGSYTIQPVAGASASPGATLTYSLNNGTNQTVVLDGNGMAIINDTPSSVGNPASHIELKSIEMMVSGSTCEIILDNEASFAANGFPTSFSVVSNSGLVCVGETGLYTITGSPGVSNPTPYAEVFYNLFITGQGTVSSSIKLDASGVGVVMVEEIPAAPAQFSPSSTISLTSAVINGCTISLSNGNSILPWDYASPVVINPVSPSICPGDDAIFNVTGAPNEKVIYDDSGDSVAGGVKSITLDGSGQGLITVTNPSSKVRIDIDTVAYSPFNNSFFAPCKVEYGYGDNFAEVEIAQIAPVSVTTVDENICFSEEAFFKITPTAGTSTPNGTLYYRLNGISGTTILNPSGEALIIDSIPAIGTPGSQIIIDSLIVDCATGGCNLSFTSDNTASVNVYGDPHPMKVSGNGPLCTTGSVTPLYTLEPMNSGLINPNGTVYVQFNDDPNTITGLTLDANGTTTVSPPNGLANSSINILTVENAIPSCFITQDDGANIDVYSPPGLVEVISTGPVCTDTIITYLIQPVSGNDISPGATVHYILDDVAGFTTLDTNGMQVIVSVAEVPGLAQSTIMLTSIENPGCTISLNSAASTDILDCGDPCYQFMVRNYGIDSANVYQVQDSISSQSCVGSIHGGGDVEYLAGLSINLDPGFQVLPGSSFLGDINPCPADETCGLISDISPLADVPNEYLRWEVIDNNTCVTELGYDINNPSPNVELHVQGFVSGNSGPFNATLEVISPNGGGASAFSFVVPVGQTTMSKAAVYVTPSGRGYFTNLIFDYDGVRLVDVTLELEPI